MNLFFKKDTFPLRYIKISSSKHNHLGITQTCQNQYPWNETLFPFYAALQILFAVDQLSKLETSGLLLIHVSLGPSTYNQTPAPADCITNTQPTSHPCYLRLSPHHLLPELPQQPPNGSPRMWPTSTWPPVNFLKQRSTTSHPNPFKALTSSTAQVLISLYHVLSLRIRLTLFPLSTCFSHSHSSTSGKSVVASHPDWVAPGLSLSYHTCHNPLQSFITMTLPR